MADCFTTADLVDQTHPARSVNACHPHNRCREWASQEQLFSFQQPSSGKFLRRSLGSFVHPLATCLRVHRSAGREEHSLELVGQLQTDGSRDSEFLRRRRPGRKHHLCVRQPPYRRRNRVQAVSMSSCADLQRSGFDGVNRGRQKFWPPAESPDGVAFIG